MMRRRELDRQTLRDLYVGYNHHQSRFRTFADREQGAEAPAVSKNMAMRFWHEAPRDLKPPSRRDYETIGYVISGCAELHSEGRW